jgi:hypothetical protein
LEKTYLECVNIPARTQLCTNVLWWEKWESEKEIKIREGFIMQMYRERKIDKLNIANS